MADGAEFCWISREGHLQSGGRERMLACLRDGSLPTDNPVTRAGWSGWFAAREVIENDGAPTTREPTFDLVRVSRRFDLDADSTIQRFPKLPSFEDVPDTSRDLDPPFSDVSPLAEASNPTQEIATIPMGMPAFCIEDAPSLQSAPAAASRRTLQSPQFPEQLAALLAPPTAPTAPTVSVQQVPTIAPTAIDVQLTAPSGTRIWPAIVGAGLAMAGAATAAMIVLYATSQLSAPTLRRGATHSVTIPAVKAEMALPTQCRAGGDEHQLARLVPPGATVHVSGQRALEVGVPSSMKSGLGIVLEPATLEERSRETFSDPVRVSGIVPRGDGGFAVDRYTVSVAGRFTLGMTPDGFSRIDDSRAATVIWPGEAAQVITRPSVTPVPGHGYLVAFRRGDGAGSVRVGMVDQAGNQRTELSRLGETLLSAGAPSVAVGTDVTAVVFSGIDAAGARRLFMGTAKLGSVPSRTRGVDLTSRAPSSPSVAALPGGRFLVTWVERPDGARRLMARVVDADLAPLAPATRLLDLDVPVAATALWVSEAGAAVLLTKVAAPSRHELSVLRLNCAATSPTVASR
jgi:hypothetical protein